MGGNVALVISKTAQQSIMLSTHMAQRCWAAVRACGEGGGAQREMMKMEVFCTTV